MGTFVVAALGMVGLPPTGGFFGKLRILLAALEAGNPLAAGAVIVTTLVTLGYFARLLERLVRGGSGESELGTGKDALDSARRHGALAAAMLALGIWNDPILEALTTATGGLGI